jgi:hypothetical protein
MALMRNSNTENENAMTGNDPIWETFVNLAYAYGVDKAHWLTVKSYGVDRADRYRDHFVATYGRKCLNCGSITYADDTWEPQTCGNCFSPL